MSVTVDTDILIQIITVLAAALAGVGIWTAVLLYERCKREKELEELTQYFMKIQDQVELPDLLKTPELSEEKRLEFTQRIDTSVNHITWLIRNLLTLSQLDAHRLKLKEEYVSAAGFLEEITLTFEPMIKLKGIRLRMETDQGITFMCDRRWTGEALSNIVKNCIEHTQNGGQITISVSQNNFSTNIRITDNGEGIAKEHLPHIFERFYKGADQSSESVGIGLAMAEKIITLQNGTISVRSEAGEGTEFLVKFYRV